VVSAQAYTLYALASPDRCADPSVNVACPARSGRSSLALSTMVSRSAYATFVVGRQPVSVEHLAATLTRLWANALRVPAEPGSS